MEHSQEEIINALKIIQDTCQIRQGSYSCRTCPLSLKGECVLQKEPPEEWEIKADTSVWKAFE